MSDGSFWDTTYKLTVALFFVVIIYRLLDAITDPPAKWLARKLADWTRRGDEKWTGTFTTEATISIHGRIIEPGTYRACGNLEIEMPNPPISGSGGDK